jgi:hypothetical protein
MAGNEQIEVELDSGGDRIQQGRGWLDLSRGHAPSAIDRCWQIIVTPDEALGNTDEKLEGKGTDEFSPSPSRGQDARNR